LFFSYLTFRIFLTRVVVLDFTQSLFENIKKSPIFRLKKTRSNEHYLVVFELPSSGWAKKGFFGNILKQHKSLASNVLCRCTRRFEHFDICCTSIVQLAMIFVTTNTFTFRTPNLLQRRHAWFIWFLHLPRVWLRVRSFLSFSSGYSTSSF
jgi:hypothetical protein